jgi:hypothetical protein
MSILEKHIQYSGSDFSVSIVTFSFFLFKLMNTQSYPSLVSFLKVIMAK